MFDGSVTTFEMIRRPATVEVIALSPENEVYYAHQQQPGTGHYDSLFSGRCEPGEAPLAAAQRELLEESGLVSTDWLQLRKYQRTGGKIEWDSYVFVARGCVPQQAPTPDAGEKIEVRRTSLHDFIHHVLTQRSLARYGLGLELRSAINEQRVASVMKEILGG